MDAEKEKASPSEESETTRIDELKRELAKGNAFTEALLENLPLGIAVHTIDKGDIGYANRRFLEIWGDWTQGDFTDLDTFFHTVYRDPKQREEARRRICSDLADDHVETSRWDDLRVTTRDGKEKILAVRNIPLPAMNLMVSTVQDITDQKLTEQALRESERRYQVMAESSPVGILRLDTDGRCCHVNKRWCEMAGLTLTQVVGESWVVAVHPDDRATVEETWRAALDQRRAYKTECRFQRPDGPTTWVFCQTEPIFDTQGELEGFIGSVTDISRRKRTEEEVRQLAYYDTLTRLPNRFFFQEQLERALATAQRTQHHVALLFCDLDNFKDINDSLGHDKGDLLLKEIGGRLSGCIRRGDTLCRLGGDEFVLLLPSVRGDQEVVSVARKIQGAMQHPFDLDGQEVYSTTSIGIAVHPEDGDSFHTLLKHADMAMYAAKGRGRNRYRFFSEDMNRRALERMSMEAGLRQAVVKEELWLAWQPQYDLCEGQLVGVEALLRWESSELGGIEPKRFIPLAEETGLIHGIGEWVLHTACTQMRRWQEEGCAPDRVAVNLSASQFNEPGLVEMVRRTLDETGLAPESLELEITESVLMQDADVALRTLRALRSDGVSLALDDFGTGFSSLLYLKNFPIGRLKIAREFVQDITRDESGSAIASAVIAMARHLSMQAVAEGVETSEQAELLRDLGCPEVQGFHFARPMSAREFGVLLR